MKKIILLLLLVSASAVAQKQLDYSKHVISLDSTLETLYGVISGDKGEARDWDKFRYLFHKDAKLIPTGLSENSAYNATYLTPEGYIESAGKWLVENGFHEVEIHRNTNTFGNITQVFSTYESYRSKSDTEPFMRGINSIQLLHDGKRWWIINIYWQQETQENPIPESYLPKN
ncbi:hypothetical protein SAMN04515667_2376 [Formosa sp. Hel1_31_208]|uniref:hypothetical protein n=1 Tax=Formosa sp. Hel1_31_208 TaxID=1798225 RepID=UPI000879294F|nr:hypothetical protein [Formosa sp. Hel1_31_208]SDS52771.1 hypothetical protein SAMN04515667_2376 [Formosa sp. Hel1_31_208]